MHRSATKYDKSKYKVSNKSIKSDVYLIQGSKSGGLNPSLA